MHFFVSCKFLFQTKWYKLLSSWSIEKRDELIDNLDKSTETPVTNNPHGCVFWKHRVNNMGYPRYALTVAKGVYCDIPVNRLVFSIMHKDTPECEFDKKDVSHLCHRRNCVNPDHLVLESRQENNARKRCVSKGVCSGHSTANCYL